MPSIVPALALILALQLTMSPAATLRAQTLQSVVVGADVVVAVLPRGMMAPISGLPLQLPMLSQLLPAATAAALPLVPVAGAAAGIAAGTGLAAGALPLLLPVAAAVALGGGLPGSVGSGSAPASTR